MNISAPAAIGLEGLRSRRPLPRLRSTRLPVGAVALALLLVALGLAAVGAAPAAAEHSVRELVSTGPTGGNGPAHAAFGGASEDGSRVFFETSEPLVAADTDAAEDVYERSGRQTTIVSDRVQAGADGANDAYVGGTSADGTHVFFVTDEPLVGADGDASYDVYQRAGGQTTLLSDRVQAGSDGAFDAGFAGASADGTRVFFSTDEPLVAADGDSNYDVYERFAGQTTLVSDRAQAGADDAADVSYGGASRDGTRVFFATTEPLVAADGDAGLDVYERSGGQITLVSDRVQPGADQAAHAFFADASADGTRVFFVTDEPLVAADGDSSYDVYERSGGQTTLVSDRVQAGADGASFATFSGASADGTRVFFISTELLVAADGDAELDVYERSGGQTTLVSDRVQPGADAAVAALFGGASADGTRVFFNTTEPLVAADGDATYDVYQHAGGQTTLLSDRVQAGADAAEHASFRGASADGSRVFFGTGEPLVAADGDAAGDVYVARIPQLPDTTITAGPSGPTNDATPTFGFSASEAGSSFECRVDTAAFAPCSSPYITAALADGAHTFEVRAADAAGHVDQTPATRAFAVDTAAPQTTIDSGPSGD